MGVYDKSGKGKTAMITGAGSGIGRACALGLADQGYQTILTGRNRSALAGVAREIKDTQDTGGTPEPFLLAMDITVREKVVSGINTVMDRFGRMDVLVNNAGIYHGGTSTLSMEHFEQQLATNLTAAFSLVKEVVPVMKKQRSGFIFNIASRSGKVGFAESGGYCASKFGLVGFTHSLVRELAEYGIRATAICPGWVATDMAYNAGTPLKGTEMIQPSDIFKTLHWLLELSPETRIKEVVIESAKSLH